MIRQPDDKLAARFDGQRVVVTGAGRAGQLGEAVARELGKRGAAVALIDRDSSAVNALAAALLAEGLDSTPFACDLTDADATADVAARVAAGAGEVHALANVAGGFAMSGPVAESDPLVFRRQLDINLGSAFGATRAFLPHVRRARGAVVFMASAAVLPGGKVAGMSAYAAAKAGVLAFMRAVAQEERANGVRANALAPTAIRTSANIEAMGSKFDYVERETVAAMIVFLCSPLASNISGQVIELA